MSAGELMHLAKLKFQYLDEQNASVKEEDKLYRPAIKKLISCVSEGVDWKPENYESIDKNPANVAFWTPERILPAEVIAWLIKTKQARELISDAGILIYGAIIKGKLSIPFADYGKPLCLANCSLPEGLECIYAQFKGLNLSGSHLETLNGQGIKVAGSVFLCDGFTANKMVSLSAAEISEDLKCQNGKFLFENKIALHADGIKVTGCVYLNGTCKSKKEEKSNPDKIFMAKGGVRLTGAKIDGDLDCRYGKFFYKKDFALATSRAKVGGNVYLSTGFESKGSVQLINMTVGTNLDCSGGLIQGMKGDNNNDSCPALDAQGIKVAGSVKMCSKFEAQGEVRLVHSTIGNDLDCKNGIFNNPDGKLEDDIGYALNAGFLDVQGSVYLSEDFYANGGVRLFHATIRGNLECLEGKIQNEGKDEKGEFNNAIRADGIKVEGGIYFRDCTFHGRVKLVRMRVDKEFQWYGINNLENVKLDLYGSHVDRVWIGNIENDEDKYKDMPHQNMYILDNFTYGAISNKMATDSAWWVEFIERQKLENPPRDNTLEPSILKRSARWFCNQLEPKRGTWLTLRLFGEDLPFSPQPYEQAAKALKEQGYVEAGREVLIAKEKRRKQTIPLIGDFSPLTNATRFERIQRSLSLKAQWFWYRILARVVGYGHRPYDAIWYTLYFVALGTFIFSWAEYEEKMVPLAYWQTPTVVSTQDIEPTQLEATITWPEKKVWPVYVDISDPKKGAPTQSITTSKPIPDETPDKKVIPLPQQPVFSPFLYSLETFVPLMPLNQEEYWQVNARDWCGWGFRFYAMTHTFIGWVITTVFLAMISGIIKK